MTRIWIGIAHVLPKPGNNGLRGAVGAFVPVVGLGTSLESFVSTITVFLEESDFSVVELDDVEPLAVRQIRCPVDPEILRLAERLDDDHRVALSTFEAYESDDEGTEDADRDLNGQ